MIALSSIEVKYMALTLVAKEATWLRLLLIELNLLKALEQYVEIKVAQRSIKTKQILTNIKSQKEEAVLLLALQSETELIA